MENFSKRTLIDRLKIELAGRGISLRHLDALLGKGKRHIFQPGKNRALCLGDVLEILVVAEIDPTVFFGQVAGYGHPLEIAALRARSGKTGWTKEENRILRNIQRSDERGSEGFGAFRGRLRQLEQLLDEDPAAAENQAWLELDAQKGPGALVSLLCLLARGAPRADAYQLLKIAGTVLGGQLRSGPGAKYALASGASFIKVGLVREGLSILENFALPLSARFGSADDQAVILIYIAKAEAKLGSTESASQALWKAVEIGGERTSFAAMQRLAFHQLNLGDISQAAQMYDDLIGLPYFHKAPLVARAAISCSRFAAHFAAGKLDETSVEGFRQVVVDSRKVLCPRDQVAAVMDFSLFLLTIGRTTEVRRTLEAELWLVLELQDSAIHKKFSELWEIAGLPRDNRFQKLVSLAKETANKLGPQPEVPITSIARTGVATKSETKSKISSSGFQRFGCI